MTALAAATRRRLQVALGNITAADEIADILEVSNVLSAAEAAFLDSVTAGTGAAGKAVVLDSNGDWFGPTTGTFVFGHTATLTVSDGDGATDCIPQHQIVGTTKAGASLLVASFNTTNDATVAPAINFLKSGHATAGSNTVVASGEILGEITAFGADGTDFESAAAQLQFVVDNTPGAGDMPGRIVVRCTTDGGETLAEVGRFNVAAGLTLGVAGTSLGKLTLSGNTAGTVTINTAATAGDWTMTLPADNGDAGEQLQTDGNGVTTWEAAGSMRAVKNVLGVIDSKAHEALERVLSRSVYAFHYKENARQTEKLPALSDTKTEFHGIMAEEYPEVMMRDGKIFNPINAFGELVLAMKAMAAEIASLKSQLAAQ